MTKRPETFEDFFSRIKRRRILKRFFGFFKWLLFTVIFLLLLSYFLLQLPPVQEFLVEWVTTKLSDDLNTEVSVGGIDVEFFDKLVLEDFYIEDLKGDTILFSKELKADFKTNIIGLLGKELIVDNIYLNSAKFNLTRDPSTNENRLQFLIDYFKSEPKKKKKKSSTASTPFLLDINGVYLNDVLFSQDDNVRGQFLSVYVDEGEILLDQLDLVNNQVDIASAILKNPIVKVIEKEKYPAPKEPQKELVNNTDTTGLINQVVTIDSSKIKKPFIANVRHFEMIDGIFDFDELRRSPVRTKAPDFLDYNHLNVFNIDIDIDSFHYELDVFSGKINKISLEEKSGFVLNELSSKDAVISENLVQLNDMKLITPESNIGDNLVFKYQTYKDFRDFNNKVKMTADFNKAEVAIQDIMVFAPVLRKNKFFKQNENEVVKIDGQIKGSINKLRGKNISLQIAGNTILKGNFNTRDLSIRGEEFLALKLERFKSNIQTLRLLVPGFNAPKNFDKLGVLDFNGRFDGFFNDFVAFGELSTDLGKAEMDMHMNLKQGRALAEYEGKLSLDNFDLKRWSGNDNLGSISFFTEVKKGKGLSLETASAILSGKIKDFTFRDYTYNNITLDGELKKNLFDGILLSKDKNIDFVFNGKIDFLDSIPKFNFDASIQRFDLQALNLSKKPIVLAGGLDLDFENFKISDIIGDGAFYDFDIISDQDTFTVDTLITRLSQDSFTVHSDVLELAMNGVFDIQEVPLLFTQYLVRNFPEFSERFNIRAKDKPLKPSEFDFKLVIPNSKNLTKLIDPKLDTIRYAFAEGRMNNIVDSVKLLAEIPFLKYGNVQLDDILLTYEGLKDESNVLLDVYHTSINNKQHFEPLKLEGFLERDTFYFDINSTNFTSVFDDLNLRGKFFLFDEYFQVQFLPSNLVILKDQWNIVEDNYIRFGQGYVETKNFDLQNFEKRIVIESIEGTGLTMSLENFDLSVIDDWWDYDKLDFDGKFFVLLEAGDVYKMEDIYATAISDSMKVNGDYLGELRLDLAMSSLKDQVDAYISIKDNEQYLIGEGFVAPFHKSNKIRYTQDFDFNFVLHKYPLALVEYFIPNGISNTVGTLNSELRLYGKLKEPKINGEAFVNNMGVTIDYLQTRYTAPKGNLKINNEFLFDASNNVIYDSLGNTATITGGIRHTALKKLRLDVSMNSDEFLFLDTDKEDNDIYYGYAVGKGDVAFSGSFQKTDININATTGPGSVLNIPVSYDQDASEVSFITFIEKDSLAAEEEKKNQKDPKGVEIDMNLEITNDAEVLLIFDERAGDIIKGKGDGNVQLQVFRNGDIKMYGDYEIESGQYLFTLKNLVNKPFTVKQGGTIRWDGDPFGATINLEAEYGGLKTAPYNFIEEYLNTEGPKSEARSSTNVGLTMLLDGPMLQPEINFDINFPNLGGELKNYTDSKLRLIRQDQNELNRQVFGLLVIGGFLPNQTDGGFQTQASIGINNTVSELLTNQLSIYLTEILSEVFNDVDFISGVDFNVNYNFYQTDQDLSQPGINVYGTEIELGTKFDLFNDRLSLNVGGSYIDQGGQYFSGDLILEYYMKNRKFKFRIYRVSDQTIIGRRDKIGVGISLRKEFNSFSEFVKGMRKSARNFKDGG